MTAQDRGSARLGKLLADPQRAARVAAIREQMNQPPDPLSLDNDRQEALKQSDQSTPHILTVDDLRGAADAAKDVNDSEVMDAAWRRPSI